MCREDWCFLRRRGAAWIWICFHTHWWARKVLPSPGRGSCALLLLLSCSSLARSPDASCSQWPPFCFSYLWSAWAPWSHLAVSDCSILRWGCACPGLLPHAAKWKWQGKRLVVLYSVLVKTSVCDAGLCELNVPGLCLFSMSVACIDTAHCSSVCSALQMWWQSDWI